MFIKHRYNAFLEYETGPVKPGHALFHVIPVPLERSVSYGAGTARGPAAILRSSQALELYDGYSVPARYGIHTKKALSCRGSIESVISRIARSVDESAERGSIPVILGGEHTVSLGALDALYERHQSLGFIQFDAHADLRDSYEGDRFSHACVMKRVIDRGIPLVQIGVRSLSPDEIHTRAQYAVSHVDDNELASSGIPEWLVPDGFPETVYITFDVDALSPALMPSTGTPEPGGLDWHTSMAMLEKAIKGRKVAGFDVVELAPLKGLHAPDYTCARLVYNIMGIITRISSLSSNQNRFFRTASSR